MAGGPAGGPHVKTVSLPPLLVKRFVKESPSHVATWGQGAQARDAGATGQGRQVERLEEQVKVLEGQVEHERRAKNSLLEAMEGILEGRQVGVNLPEHAVLLGRLERAVRGGGAVRDLNNNREVEAPVQAGRKVVEAPGQAGRKVEAPGQAGRAAGDSSPPPGTTWHLPQAPGSPGSGRPSSGAPSPDSPSAMLGNRI